MKTKIILAVLAFLFPAMLWAQAPQAFTYQAIARDAQGNPLVNQSISLRISIKNSQSGAAVYQETQTGLTTNQFGLFTIQVGNGIPVSGTFAAINWSTSPEYIKVEFDPSGGTNYLDMGTTQLLSVPYALYAASSGSAGGTQTVYTDATLAGNGTSGTPLGIAQQGASTGQTLKWDGSIWTPANDNDNQTLSISGSQLTIAGGNTVTLPTGAGGDNWGTQTVVTDGSLTGNGTGLAPLGIPHVGATAGQVLTWNGTAWAPANAGGGATYTAGTGISITGNTITNTAPNQQVSITGGGSTTVTGTYPSFTVSSTDAQTLSLTGNTLSISNGNNVTLPSGSSFTLPYSNTVNSASNLFSITNSGSGSAGGFTNSSSASTTNALIGQTSGTGYGVYGANTHTSGSGLFGVYGTYATTAHGAGVAGIGTKGTTTDLSSGSFNIGVYGSADSIGVLGDVAAGNSSVGVYGTSDYVGTWGNNFSTTNGTRTNIYDATAIGGYFGSSGGEGSYSIANGTDIYGTSSISNGAVNLALSSTAAFNVGTLSMGFGLGNTGSATGIQAYAQGTAQDMVGVYATTLSTGTVSTYAAYLDGDVYVNGNLSKAAGTFKIDDPLDPANKYLYHSFVESPDMMNIYNGNITTDANGEAVVTLPDYFDVLNKDFRYQLTVIGSFAQAMVEEKVANNQFKIKTNQPNIEVSWQVTGVRQDPYANAHRVVAEVEKKGNERGRYLHPELYGKTANESMSALFSPLALSKSAPLTLNTLKVGLKAKTTAR